MTYDQAERVREAIDGVLAGSVVVLGLAGIFLDNGDFLVLTAIAAIILVAFEGAINLLAYLTDF